MKKFRILFLVLLAVTGVCLGVGISQLVAEDTAMPLFATIILLVLGGMSGFANFFIGFFAFIVPLGNKASLAMQEQLYRENEQRLKTIAAKNGEIAAEGLKAVYKETMESGTVYCKYCGKAIPADSIYCKHCGEKQ